MGAFVDFKNRIWNTIKNIIDYLKSTVVRYFSEISKLRTRAFISGIAVSVIALPVLIPLDIIVHILREFGLFSGGGILSFCLEKLYLSIRMIFGEEENFNINQFNINLDVEEEGNQDNQNLNIEQDISEIQLNHLNFENEPRKHESNMIEDFLKSTRSAINFIQDENFFDDQQYSFTFTNENNINDHDNNNEIFENSMMSYVSFKYLNNPRSLNLQFINEVDEFCDDNVCRNIMGSIIERLKNENLSPRIMENLNDGSGEREVNLDEVQDLSILKILILLN